MTEVRELFPVTFFQGNGPVVMGGTQEPHSDFRPKVEAAGAGHTPEPPSGEDPPDDGDDSSGTGSPDQTEVTEQPSDLATATSKAGHAQVAKD